MGPYRLGLASAAIGALAMVSCVSASDTVVEAPEATEPPPFIDPVVLAESRCSGAKPQAPSDAAAFVNTAEFDYGAPFILPGEVVAHFRYPISAESDAAQIWFNMGLAHMANFNHDEAIAAFRKAQQYDPDCAMCFWGEGLAFGSNINAPFDPARGMAGRAASDAAMELIDGANERETALIEALATRYSVGEDGAMVENAMAYAEAMDEVAVAFPDDKFILSLAAEANLDTQPWDYWQASGRAPKGRTARTIEMLETALEIDPNFAPAIHLYIHATEASVDPFRAEAYADRLAALDLGVGHLVHMPSHIYLRLGHWKKSHEANIAAIAADEAYIAGSENGAFYSAVYYPHNVHFVVANSQLGGAADTALEVAAKIEAMPGLDPSAPNPFGEHVAASPLFARLQFGETAAILDAPEPPAAHLYLRTAWHFTRGSVLTQQGDLAAAHAEMAAIEALSGADGFDVYGLYGVPVDGIMDVARLTLEARILEAEGDLTGAIAAMDEAADRQEALPYMEPTWWYYPTRQSLGALLLKDGQTDRAEREFFRTLIKVPNSAYALYGLAETYKVAGDTRSEDYARHLFQEAWIGEAGDSPDLSNL